MNKRWVNQKRKAQVMPRPSVKDPRPYVTCTKCNHTIIMTCIDRHLEVCQPNGALCPVCKEKIKPIGFVAHLQGCYKLHLQKKEEANG